MNLKDILPRLKEPVPPHLIKSKTKKNTRIDFISWYNYCGLLDERTDNSWEWEIVQMTATTDRIFVVGKLTIHGDDKSASMMATGTELLSCGSWGDPSSNAEAMALRRCCAKFGLARSLWEKDEDESPLRNGNGSKTLYKTKSEISREEWLAKYGNKNEVTS